MWLLFALACSDYELHRPLTTEAPLCATPEPDPYPTESDPTCASAPVVGSFTPVVEWNWADNPIDPGYDQVMAAPVVGNLTDDNGDGVIDENDVPDVVFTAFAGGAYTSPGAIVAVSGSDGSTLWSVTSAGGVQPYSSSGVAIADVDGSGQPKVFVSSTGGLLCLDADGGFEWVAPVAASAYGHPAVGDVDGDGVAEIVYGPSVVNADGTVRWTGAGGSGSGAYLSFPVDLDGDGLQEVVAGNTVYDEDGSVRWTDGQGDGFTAVGDLDGDGKPEVVTVYYGTVRATHADGTPLWSIALDDGGGGPPTIADFDGDGQAEVGIASRSYYRVLDGDGTELWRDVVQDYSSSVTGSSVFDFEGDGAAEVVYADEETLWVYDGATGAVELAWDSHSSGTLFEYPLVVDVDHDGASEIVVASNDYAFAGSRGITVIGDQDSTWSPARPVWNQHAYSISNVNDDLTVPARPEPNWGRWNSFRAGNSQTAVGLQLADLSVGEPQTCLNECSTHTVEMWIPIENGGLADAHDVDVALYTKHGEKDALWDVETVDVVPAGGTAWIGPVRIDQPEFGRGLTIRADDDGSGRGRVAECDETNDELVIDAFACDL